MVVEDDPAFLKRFCQIIATDPDLELFAAVGDGASARQALMKNAPDVASALCSIFIGGILVNRFLRNLNGFEKLTIEPESRVAQKHAELEDNYQRMQLLERQSAAVEERQRIMRDMHDGLGAQLISTLSLVEHGDLPKEEVAVSVARMLG